MASVTVATKAYADSVLGQSVVSGTVNGSGHLILTRSNGSTFDGGDFTTPITAIVNNVLSTAALKDILSQSSTAAKVALTAKGFAGQTADIFQVVNSAGTVLGRVDAAGKLKTFVLEGVTIDGDLNTLLDINATKLQGHLVTVATTAPASPAVNDIWINPNGT